jgi:hypothetical protein
MKRLAATLVLLAAGATTVAGAEDFLDRVDQALTFSARHGSFRARLSGTMDLEGYRLAYPPPALIYTSSRNLFNPRLAFFLDAQLGRKFYLFAQARVDRGFDPSDDKLHARMDEYALRFTPGNAAVNVQVGKFATVVGSWVTRHGSWENPFITAPLPYENLTGMWDIEAVPFRGKVLQWAHVRPGLSPAVAVVDKERRLPIIWGPSYATGAAISGAIGRFRYAVELKNGALASRPSTWKQVEELGRHPTTSGRLSYQPNHMWQFGVSASDGVYLAPAADRTMAPGHGRGDYRQTVFGQEVSFAWHRLQLWAEAYQSRFTIPTLDTVGTVAYYVEAKYKFTPQFFGSVRWNQQFFDSIPDGAGTARWGRDVSRFDVAPIYRFTPHTQLKLQYSFQHERNAARENTHLFAAQFTVRF